MVSIYSALINAVVLKLLFSIILALLLKAGIYKGYIVGNKKAGGLARAESLSPERRKEIGAAAIKTRWENEKLRESLPQVIMKKDDLRLADVTIPCAIVEGANGGEPIRVLTETGIYTAIFGLRSGGAIRLKRESIEAGAPIPLFLTSDRLKPFINKENNVGALLSEIQYVDGKRIVTGYDARILPVVCDIWLKAREAGALQKQQLDKAQKAEILMRALAHVGIIALVDEATGFQNIRAKDALAKILEAFVAKELQPYVKRFPSEFYQEIFRLRGLNYPNATVKRPQYFGHITNDIIYRRMAPGVWKELKAKAMKDEKGRLKNKLFQNLTPDIGDPRLQKVITQVVTIMQLSKSWPDFKSKLDKLVPAFNETMPLFNEETDDGLGI